jgi:branched-chain amino acid transport system ATP-binding protein
VNGLLSAQSVTKKFAGITALDSVSLDVGEREIVGLIGPNGAGKTTFFNCLLGLLKLDGGSVTFEGRDLARVPTHKRARLGIGRTFQRIELFSGMSPRDHFLVAERVRNGRGALCSSWAARHPTRTPASTRCSSCSPCNGWPTVRSNRSVSASAASSRSDGRS